LVSGIELLERPPQLVAVNFRACLGILAPNLSGTIATVRHDSHSAGRWAVSILLRGTALSGLPLQFGDITTTHQRDGNVVPQSLADLRQADAQPDSSLLAVGSGGTWGTGLGLSQQKLFYLDHSDTDFIFAVFAEELCFTGSLPLLPLIYATLCY